MDTNILGNKSNVNGKTIVTVSLRGRGGSGLAFHLAAVCIVFMLFMCVSLYLIAADFKARTADAENSLNEATRVNSELLKRGEELDGLINNEQNKLQLIEDEISREYEDRIKACEDMAAELWQKIEELSKIKDDISSQLSSTIGSFDESYVYDNETDSEVLSLSEDAAWVNAVGGPAQETRLDLVYENLKSDLAAEENDYVKMRERLGASYLNGDGVKFALANGVKRENIPTMWPVTGKITSWYGNRSNPFGGGGTEGHNGIDIAVVSGTPVVASGGGVVQFAGYNGGYGYLVILDHGGGLVSYYGHNSSLRVQEGQQIKRGQVISLSGSTGRSTGPHVHFEMRFNNAVKDPLVFVKAL